MNKPTTRAEKIRLLKDLQSGNIAAIRELLPPEFWLFHKGEYTNMQTGEVLTESQYQAKYSNGKIIHNAEVIFMPDFNCPPLARSEDEVQL